MKKPLQMRRARKTENLLAQIAAAEKRHPRESRSHKPFFFRKEFCKKKVPSFQPLLGTGLFYLRL